MLHCGATNDLVRGEERTVSDREALRAVIDKLIGEVWNNQRLDLVPEVFKEGATLRVAGNDLTGFEAIREEYMRPVQTAFPDLHHEAADLFFDGDKIAMRYVGSGTHRGDYDGKAAAGSRLDYEGIALFHMEGTRIAEVWAHSNWAQKFADL